MKSPQGLPGFAGVLNTGMVRTIVMITEMMILMILMIIILWHKLYAQYRMVKDHDDDNENEDEEDDIIIRMMKMFQDDAKVMVACLYIGIGFFGYLKFGPAVEPVSSYHHNNTILSWTEWTF